MRSLMKSRLLRFTFVEPLMVICLAVAAYVFMVGPIDAHLRPLGLRCSSPARPLMAAAALLLLRLLLPAAARLWNRTRSPLTAIVRSPFVWVPAAILLLGVWPLREWIGVRRATAAVERVRETRRAELGLTTRPVLTTSEMIAGAALAGARPEMEVEIACGLAPEVERVLGTSRGPVRVQIALGPPRSRPDERRTLASFEITPGAWTPVRARLPRTLGVEDHLFASAEGAGAARTAPFLVCSRPRALPDPDPARPNLIVISIDTLRADHLGAYGYLRPVSPSMDRLAREGTLFEQAFAQAPWTTPSHMSLFTSMFPSVHGVDAPSSNRQRRLPDDRRTLAEVLSAAGYLTAAFTGSGSISAVFGFWRGFDLYAETAVDDPASLGDDVAGVFEKASRWLVDHHDRPFFVFLHTYEVHEPFTHAAFLGEADPADATAKLTALYDGDVLAADGFVGQILGLLDGLGLRDRTIVVLLSDHGEEMAPRYPGRRLGHGHTVYDDLLHVPLIIAAPGRVPAAQRVGELVQVIDVMPTVLELLGVPAPAGLQGESFAAVFRGRSIAPRAAFAECTNCGPERKTIREGRFKYVRTFARAEPPSHPIPVAVPDEEFFDLSADPGERHSLLTAGGADLERLRHHLQAIVAMNLARRGTVAQQDLDAETVERLKALGYIR